MLRVFNRGVTVATIDGQLARVQRVTERDRLFGLITDVGGLRREAKVDDEECIECTPREACAEEILDFVRPRRKVKQAHFCSP